MLCFILTQQHSFELYVFGSNSFNLSHNINVWPSPVKSLCACIVKHMHLSDTLAHTHLPQWYHHINTHTHAHAHTKAHTQTHMHTHTHTPWNTYIWVLQLQHGHTNTLKKVWVMQLHTTCTYKYTQEGITISNLIFTSVNHTGSFQEEQTLSCKSNHRTQNSSHISNYTQIKS